MSACRNLKPPGTSGSRSTNSASRSHASESLAAAGLIEANKGPAKLLSNGELSQAYVVRGVKMSAGARQKIEAAGGRVED